MQRVSTEKVSKAARPLSMVAGAEAAPGPVTILVANAASERLDYTGPNAAWLRRIEAQFTALRYFALEGTGHASQHEQASMIRRPIIWRNNRAHDERLRRIANRANVA